MPTLRRNRFGGAHEWAAGVLTGTRLQGSGTGEWLNYRHHRRIEASASTRGIAQFRADSIELQEQRLEVGGLRQVRVYWMVGACLRLSEDSAGAAGRAHAAHHLGAQRG